MEFINNFVCFQNQEIETIAGDNLLVIDSPFIAITSSDASTVITGLNVGIDGTKSYMLFLINRTANNIVIEHLSTSVDTAYRVKMSNNLDYTLSAGSFCVLIRDNNQFLLKAN